MGYAGQSGFIGGMKAGAKGLLRNARKEARRWARVRRYAGDRVECPFCGKTFDRFQPSGALERPFWQSGEGRRLLALDWICVANALCPNCGSGERHRLLWFYLKEHGDFLQKKGAMVLDVAPDRFIHEAFFKNADIEYISIDVNSARRPTYVMDLTDMTFMDGSFDFIMCYHVLEHVPDDMEAARELRRVLKPDGWAIIQVPVWAEQTHEDPAVVTPEDRARLFGHPDHVRRYGPDFAGRLREAGFEVILDDFARRLPAETIARYGIHEHELLTICRAGNGAGH